MLGNNKSQRGFTTIELLVVLSIFTIMTLIITNVYIIALKAQRETSVEQRMIGTMRDAVESIVRNIRISQIDYAAYGGGLDTEDERVLRLINQDGITFVYQVVDGVLEVIVDGETFPVTNPDEMQILSVIFFIMPGSNPFAQSGAVPDFQPRVTMRFAYQAVGVPDAPVQYLQTTVTSRVYLR